MLIQKDMKENLYDVKKPLLCHVFIRNSCFPFLFADISVI